MDDTLLAATVLGSICVGLGVVLMVAQVRKDELTTVMEPGQLEMTVVACGLRGFTAYAAAVPARAVNHLLDEYHAAVGRAVAEVAGTVEDGAGDGVLVLIGAPPREDHVSAGLALARRIHEVTAPVIDRWSTGPHPLGVGVGVATGSVAIVPTRSEAPTAYTVVGTPVNLASQLCSTAPAGETLVDDRGAIMISAPGWN
jgi:adenylate cyclase